ncbi:MAG: 4Fe-4S binding protein [Eubacteriales bacterium]|nr:4Fe-4S binding protein [Eubacteriales bacterium]
MYEVLIKRFEIPEAAAAFVDVFFIKEDIAVIEGVENPQCFTESDLIKILGQKSPQEYLQNAYERGVVSHQDETHYSLNNFYGFLDVFVVTQKEKYHRCLTREERGRIDDWYFSTYCGRLNPDYSQRPTEDVILTLEESWEYIDRDDRQLFWTNCDCKCLLGDCGLPTKVCLSYSSGDNTYSDRKVSEPVSKEKAKQIMTDADKAGLIHTWNPSGFCNCCGDCCYLFRAQQVRQSQKFWPKQNYEIRYDAEKCVGCGLCVKRCHFQVFTKTEDKKVALDLSGCVGCGLCANTCPKSALNLVKIGGEQS